MMATQHRAPMDLLPPELIRIIFLCCLTEAITLSPARFELVLVLTHTCTTWRAIALGTPELWQNFRLGDQRPVSSRLVHPITAIWLSRAPSHCALSLYGVRYTLSSRSFSFLRPHFKRCSRLALLLGTTELYEFMTLPAECLGRLKDLELRLAKFHACNVLNMHDLRLDWRGMTTLHLSRMYVSASSCLGVLRDCILLEECQVNISRINDGEFQKIIPYTERPIVLPSLHTLALYIGPAHHSAFLNALQLPGLRRLYPRRQLRYHWPVTLFRSFLAPSGFLLAELNVTSIHHIHISNQDELCAILRLVPHLTTLHLSGLDRYSDTMIEGLGSGDLVPRLRNVTVQNGSLNQLFCMLEQQVLDG
ncbi:hypothetical protein BD779DRAFT_1560207 [Infundibulicybe gibba]|nr:hypothetical protein BD779DRAFT_1560207 [Infundibulicybe gibba]